MPEYILLSISPNLPPEQVIGADLTPELIQTIIQKYNDWTAELHATGKLKALNKAPCSMFGSRASGQPTLQPHEY